MREASPQRECQIQNRTGNSFLLVSLGSDIRKRTRRDMLRMSEPGHQCLEALPLSFLGIARGYHFVPCPREAQSPRGSLEKRLDLLDGMLRRSVRRDGLAVFHSLGIMALVGKQQSPAPERFKATHVAAVRTGHVDGAVQDDLRSRKHLIVVAAKH